MRYILPIISMLGILWPLVACKQVKPNTIVLSNDFLNPRFVKEAKSPFKMAKSVTIHAFCVSRSDYLKFSEMIKQETSDTKIVELSKQAMLLYPFNRQSKALKFEVVTSARISLPQGYYIVYSHPNNYEEFDVGWAFWDVSSSGQTFQTVQVVHQLRIEPHDDN